MDAYEATRVVFSRIQSLDPDHAAKIMGLLLLQDHGDKEMIRLAFGPESLLHSLILKARLDLGLPLSRHNPPPPPPLSISSPSWAPAADADDFPPDLNLEMGWDPQLRRSYSAGVGDLGLSSPEGPGFGWKPCLYFARGFCKNGSSCRFLHGLNEDKLDAAIDEQRRRLAAAAAGGGGFPYSPTGGLPMSPSSPMNQRAAAAAAAALMLAGDESRFMGRSRIDRSEFAGMVNPASRQIYLTFPADSTFREEDVSNYFSIYGPVQDVRIPYQQKRMFGFVTFVYPETVKLILAKGNPHFVCDARVLVKPYKEKGKVPDKYRKQQQGERGDFSGCTTPTGLDSRDPFDLGARIMYNNANNSQEMLLRRKLEEEQQAFELQQAIEMQGRRFMGLQLLDFKNRSPAISSPTTITTAPSNDRSSEESPTEDKSPSFVSSGGEQQQQLKAVNAADDKEESGSPDEDSDFQNSGEHNLPDSPFASPTKDSSLFAGDPFSAASAFSSVPAHSNGNGNANNLVPSTLDVASFKSCFFQTPRLSSGHGAVGL